jgi:hypothetical protein
MLAASVTTVQTSVGSFTQPARRQFPLAMGLFALAVAGSEHLGERASHSRFVWVGLGAIPVVLFAIDPAAAQVACNEGMLAFLGDLKTIVVEGMGILLFVILVAAGLMKMSSFKGANRAGNALLGAFFIGVGFYVLGPALIDIADSATPVDMSTQCNAGGSSN